MKSVIQNLKKNLDDNDCVILGCSGGPDSMCLLSLLETLNVKIICAHINHNVRKESSEEFEYLKDYCAKKHIIFEGTSLKFKSNNFEAEARKKRYEFFNKLQEKYHAKYIITGHHGDDLIETILMRLSRGSNLSGYAGIKLIDNKYYHPLLFTTKKEIQEYLNENKIKYFIDVTNQSDVHTRNNYRHTILPFLKTQNPNVHKKYLEYSNELLEYDNFIKEYINNKKIINSNSIDLIKLKNESDFIKKKTIELLINIIQKDNVLDINRKSINQILRIINNTQPNLEVSLNNGYIAKKNYNYLTIEKEHIIVGFNEEFKGFFETTIWKIQKVDSSDDHSNYAIYLDSSELKLPLIIRSREDGDNMEVKNLGTKKLKDIFIDNKIPLAERDSWPVVTDSNNKILWLPGIKKSKFDKNIQEKYDIILTGERKNNK